MNRSKKTNQSNVKNMKDRSQLAMLVGLAALVIVVFQFFPASGMQSLFHGVRGVLPWIIFAFVMYLLFGKGGCCGKKPTPEDDATT